MNGRSLEAIATAIPVPVDGHGRRARAYARWEHGVGYFAAFALDGGRLWGDQIGPVFSKPVDAARLAALLNGDQGPVPRSAPEPSVATPAEESEVPGRGPTEAPVPPHPESASESAPSAASGTPPRTCVSCGRALPPGSRPQRRTCSHACRERARYRRAAGQPRATSLGADAVLTLSGPSEADTAADQLALSLG